MEAGAERIGTMDGKINKALIFGEKEPACGRESLTSSIIWGESHTSGDLRMGESWNRQRQDERVLDQAVSGWSSKAPEAVRTHRR